LILSFEKKKKKPGLLYDFQIKNQEFKSKWEFLPSGSIFSNLGGSDMPKYQWIHLAGVYDYTNREIKMYYNGVLQDDVSYLGNFDLSGASSLKLNIGRYVSSYSYNYHVGKIDEVRIYNRALSESEIQDLYIQGGGGGNELTADAGGPYSGSASENIQFTGGASGGTPYTYAWDLDNDGQYDDATGATASKSWNAEGTYLIKLKIYYNGGNTDTDTAYVIIGEQPSIEGLVGYWKFDESGGFYVYDTSEYENDGLYCGSNPSYVDGSIGSGLNIDEPDEYIRIADTPSLDFEDTNAFTLSLCFKWDGTADYSFNAIINQYFAWEGYRLGITDNGNVKFYVGVGGGNDYVLTSNMQLDNEWHKIIAIWDGYMQYIYIDGILDNSIYHGDGVVKDWDIDMIFGNGPGGVERLGGIIDEIRIYDRALDNSEINARPTVTITTPPADYEVVSDTVTITGIANDPDGNVFLKEIRIYDETDNILLNTITGVTSWSYDWDTAQVDDGHRKIKVVSYDGVDFSEPQYINCFVSNHGISLPKAEPLEACEVLATARLNGRIIDRGGDTFYNCLYNVRYRKQGTSDWEYPEPHWQGYLSDEDFYSITDYLEHDTIYEFQVGAGNSITRPIGVWNENDIVLFTTPLRFWDDSTDHEYDIKERDVGGNLIPIGMDEDDVGSAIIDGKRIDLDIGPYYDCATLGHYSEGIVGATFTTEEDISVKVTMTGTYSGCLYEGVGASCDGTITCYYPSYNDNDELVTSSTELKDLQGGRDSSDGCISHSGSFSWTSNPIILSKNDVYNFKIKAEIETSNICVVLPPPINDAIFTTTHGYLEVVVDYIKLERVGGAFSNDLTFSLLCPADLKVTDPMNRITSKTISEIPDSTYEETDLNSDGELDDQIYIPEALEGEYTIVVLPESGASPNDNFSLSVDFADESYYLAEGVNISYIPENPYSFQIIGPHKPIKPIGPILDCNEELLTYSTVALHPNGERIWYLWNWGDGNNTWVGPLESGIICYTNHTWSKYGNYDIKVKAKHGIESDWSDSLTLEILNRSAADAGGLYSGLVGEIITFDGSGSYSPDGFIVLWDWDFGDGNTGIGTKPNHIYEQIGTYAITLTVVDNNGFTDTDNTLIKIIEDVNPPITSKAVGFPNYGVYNEWVTSLTEFNLTATDDLSGVDKTYYKTWYNGLWTPWVEYIGNFTLLGEGKHIIEYYSIDNVGNVEEVHNQTHYVDDTPPQIVEIILPADPIQIGTTVELNASFYDQLYADTHSATVDWGDGNTTSGMIDETNQTVTGNWSYAQSGVYTVNLTVEDYFGRTDWETFQYVVVYDPGCGFVTGGGWIDSPSGAYIPNASLTGKANFGFVSKYKKGHTIPTGNTQFNFQEADLNFHSDNYQWMVIIGSCAIYKGSGTINGEGDYRFIVTVFDGAEDMFGIKIYDNSNVIYDSGLIPLGGGQIKIHN